MPVTGSAKQVTGSTKQVNGSTKQVVGSTKQVDETSQQVVGSTKQVRGEIKLRSRGPSLRQNSYAGKNLRLADQVVNQLAQRRRIDIFLVEKGDCASR